MIGDASWTPPTTPHPFPNVTVEDRGHGRGVSHVAFPDGSWMAMQHNLDERLYAAMLKAWRRVWDES